VIGARVGIDGDRVGQMIRPRAYLLAASLLMAVPAAWSQDTAPACVLDSAAHRRAFDLYLSLAAPRTASAEEQEAYQAIAIAIASVFQQPTSVSLPGWPGTFVPFDVDSADPVQAYLGLAGSLELNLDRDGHLVTDAVHVVSGSPEVAFGLRQAVRSAAAQGELPRLTRAQWPQHGRVHFQLLESQRPIPDAVAIVHVKIQGLAVDELPRLVRPAVGDSPALASDVWDEAVWEFVIAPTGRAIPSSFSLLKAKFSEYAEAARDILVRSVFQPAMIDGCPVPMLVREAVRFQVP